MHANSFSYSYEQALVSLNLKKTIYICSTHHIHIYALPAALKLDVLYREIAIRTSSHSYRYIGILICINILYIVLSPRSPGAPAHRPSPQQTLFLSKALLREFIILVLPPPPDHQRLLYCNTIARSLRNIRPGGHRPSLCMPYTIQHW